MGCYTHGRTARRFDPGWRYRPNNGHQAVGLKCLLIAPAAPIIFHTRRDEVEQDLGQALAAQPAQIIDAQNPGAAHTLTLTHTDVAAGTASTIWAMKSFSFCPSRAPRLRAASFTKEMMPLS